MYGSSAKTAAIDLFNRNDSSIKVYINKVNQTTASSIRTKIDSATQRWKSQVFYDDSAGVVYVNFYSSDTGKATSLANIKGSSGGGSGGTNPHSHSGHGNTDPHAGGFHSSRYIESNGI